MIFADRFVGKTLVITGAAQGIGRAVALRAAAEGGNVLFVDRADFVNDVAAEAGARGRGFVCDLETCDGAARAIAEAASCFGSIDVLINNVGGAIRMRPYDRFEPEQIEAETAFADAHVMVLPRGASALPRERSRHDRQHLVERDPGRSSRALFGGERWYQRGHPEPGDGICLAQHRVVTTAPGGTDARPRRVPHNVESDTSQERIWMTEVVGQVKESSFFKRYGTIDEQAAPILFLASDEASYITGSILPVAGGDLG
jgi:dihydroxycyclohexadiene carboxylate dehydrogenase